MQSTMTSKERWLAALHLEPVDRLPFWPKLDNAYPRAQSASFQNKSLDELHAWIGSDRHKGIGGCVREVRVKTSVETRREDGILRTLYRTPHGEMEMVRQFDEPSQSWHPVKFPVEKREDIRRMTALFDDVRVELDPEALEQSRRNAEEIGGAALTCNNIGESPLMYWVEWLAGIENAHYLLADHTDEVETLFESIHRHLVRTTELLSENSAADVLYLIENTSTTLISPEQYRRYCLRHVGEYARITSEAGRNLILHMCGHLKALLPELSTIPAQAFEAFTSPTVGNTTLLDGRLGCPDKCLVGGTNAALWIESADGIISQIERDLSALPHHRGIVLTSGGVMPPLCKPETIKEVCDWVKAYPARMSDALIGV